MTFLLPLYDEDVNDLAKVQVGKPYRGSLVEKIKLETKHLPGEKVKIVRSIRLEGGIYVTETSYHAEKDVYVDGKLLPHDQIQFPSSASKAPVYDEMEKMKKREILRQRAREMMKQRQSAKTRV